jgi:hypothetical protein
MSDSDGFGGSSDAAQRDEVPPDVQRAREDWTAIEHQQAELEELPTETGVGHVVIDRGYAITFFDSRIYLADQAQHVSADVPPLVENPTRLCCISSPNKAVHIDTWRTIFRISKLSFDESDLTHHRILNSLHSLITGCGTAPLRRGDHWRTIGFQSDDPIRDVRAAGMLGLLLPFHLFAKFGRLGPKLAQTARLPGQEFPMMIVLINFTMDAVNVAGGTQVIKTASDFAGCWDEMAFFFAGIVETLCSEWTGDHCDDAHDFDRFQRISHRAVAAPDRMIATGKRILAQEQLQQDS